MPYSKNLNLEIKVEEFITFFVIFFIIFLSLFTQFLNVLGKRDEQDIR